MKLMQKNTQPQAGETSGNPKKKNWWKGKKKRVAGIVILLLVICGAVSVYASNRQDGEQVQVSYSTEEVARRSITNSLTGSGTLEPADSYTVTSLVSGEILSDTFEEGDIVEEDALLYTIDSSDASSNQTQAENSYEQALKAKYPTADLTGTVSDVYVKDGENVSAGTELCKIVGDNTITMDFQFSYASSSDFYVGQSATIFLSGFEDSITGTVEQVSQSSAANASGMVMTTVRVTAVNPGLVTEDCTANAVIGNYTSYGWTDVQVAESSVITASASGKISGMNLLPGDPVKNGQRICTITGDSVDNQLENALTSLENAQDNLENYRITSPISGTVVEKYAKTGDNVGTSSNGTNTLCIIYDLSYLEMTLNIDELDINSVAVGQKVSITADAVEGMSYEGEVTKVSVVGTTTGGITTYPVTVRIDQTEGLRPGMNVDAEIVLSSAENVLAVPNGAVNRGNTVLITADSPSAVNALEQEAPEGYVYVQVETGVSDDSYIEIISGLQEGDIVAYLRTASAQNEMMMMPGAMGGSMVVAVQGGPGGGGMAGGMGGGGPKG